MLEKLQGALLDEYEDVVDYCAMAEKAGDEYKSILHTIAKEEWTHAKHLKDIIEDMGGKMSDEMKAAHDEAHDALYK